MRALRETLYAGANLLEFTRAQSAFLRESEIRQRVGFQIPIGFRDIGVHCDGIGGSNQRLLQQNIVQVSSCRSIAHQDSVTVDHRQGRPYEVRKIYQAFVDLLMKLIALPPEHSIPILHSEGCARESMVLRDRDIDNFVNVQEGVENLPLAQDFSFNVDIFEA